jgi:LruC domain-containing protein
MKKVYILVLAALVQLGAKAQTVSVNAESGDRNIDAANCWAFGANSFTNTSGLVINGAWSIRSNQITNVLADASWIKSPWIKLNSGSITIKVRNDGSPGSTRAVRVRFIPYDANSLSSFKEGAFLGDSSTFNMPAPPATTLQNISFAVPVSIAGNNNPYKVMISFVGTGGTGRMISDDIVIPGTYWANPLNNCLPQSGVTDTDGDGVADVDDAYPTDVNRAYNNYYPSQNTFGSLMYEDLWPATGDYDFNDLVVDYRLQYVSNAANNVVELKAKFVTRAIGATFKNSFLFQFDDVAANKVISVTGTRNTSGFLSISANGTEAGQTNANIPVFDNAINSLGAAGAFSGFGINVDKTVAAFALDTINLTVTFINNGTPAPGGTVSYTSLSTKFNPYIAIDQTRGREVHLPNKVPSALASPSFFRTDQDDTNPAGNKYYKTVNNLPWVLNVNQSLPYPSKNFEISGAYTKFLDWAGSEGTLFPDWYLDLPSYRNNDKLY